ncbi:chromatin DNA-binding EKC/KEOPS complex subunit PCC1 [Sporobolomyces salmoneus]|uniref:chromatin DNA-binding EKC/KEOPS complex subunit PCC1 n=1 Tax=Sporobolomyces salmoneus TaxID=183962 RepID=UPI0031722F01
MATQTDASAAWHNLSIKIPFPSAANAVLVKQVIEVDEPLRPTELKRSFEIEGSSLVITFLARTVAQARVALDHALSDIQLVVQTMHNFGPEELVGEKISKDGEEAPSLEVGLEGSWGSLKRG